MTRADDRIRLSSTNPWAWIRDSVLARESSRTLGDPSRRSSRPAAPERRRFATPLPLLIALTVAALSGATSTAATAQEFQERVANATELRRMREFLTNRVETSSIVAHFVSPDGSEVDCVDIYRQPALLQPEMRGHQIEFQPGSWPSLPEASRRLGEERAEPVSTELGLGCPEGSVPIPRITLDTLRRFRTLDDFFKKVPSHLENAVDKRAVEAPQDLAQYGEPLPLRDGPTSLHQYAHAYQVVSNLGAHSILNLWSPFVERSNEFSLSQIWVLRGSGKNLETVEAGWQVFRDLYGDSRAHLFIYYRPDTTGGCYNNTCGKFVQVSSTITPGTGYSAYSTLDGPQQTIALFLYKDGASGHWWLRHGDTWVGYWPRSLFDAGGLRDRADKVDFGGEIIDRQIGGWHTRTDMGSGRFPSAGFGRAAYHRGIVFVDTAGASRHVSLIPSRTDTYCYDIVLGTSTASGWQRHFYFGGPGYNADCE